ncbi:hypothetical protein A3D00_01005 [Candidatus Woesebacteria bacterium RIFCSPHIGHO2_02_FULL_38_9]|uniref:DUF4258 domain-containing protein n=1 Tax=Candidatus Woesebacteria bacterium RIFCSPHIGHO2_01_FULL_39_28 TaxID=1802496 RepID=A0A1F7YIE4_9BACT|nr:MAG: hypothetical protein A2627_01390 [Candidatus Woesebacteria bacterium RIFCSPHIGHO2_01_FULL_39_28]OGM31703.1 MAG: hypothetical protein A3D00_01005 [Candidatus Woesebacteria bacterium RIFCSPHIGHO2_02_FULL_38_9]OGM57642.1 MAG: hypothetical protein A3A50_01380 [Candidatus Woesebacteria bacterium RIFCSPLOWO2_01_FULL_38_20]
MRIIYTKNALGKFLILKKHNLVFSRRKIEQVVSKPEHFDITNIPGKIIVSKSLDKTHVLQVVYKVYGDIMKIITFYPAEKEE